MREAGEGHLPGDRGERGCLRRHAPGDPLGAHGSARRHGGLPLLEYTSLFIGGENAHLEKERHGENVVAFLLDYCNRPRPEIHLSQSLVDVAKFHAFFCDQRPVRKYTTHRFVSTIIAFRVVENDVVVGPLRSTNGRDATH